MVHSGRTCQRTGPAAKHVVSHARMLGNRPESCLWDLNPGPRPYQGRALPTEPRQRCLDVIRLAVSRWRRRLGTGGDAGFSYLDFDRPRPRLRISPSCRERVMGIEPTLPAWK